MVFYQRQLIILMHTWASTLGYTSSMFFLLLLVVIVVVIHELRRKKGDWKMWTWTSERTNDPHYVCKLITATASLYFMHASILIYLSTTNNKSKVNKKIIYEDTKINTKWILQRHVLRQDRLHLVYCLFFIK